MDPSDVQKWVDMYQNHGVDGLTSKCGVGGNHSVSLSVLDGKRGFQPQNKPPVHTSGFDFFRRINNAEEKTLETESIAAVTNTLY